MLTPAEESGLAGLRLAGRVQRAVAMIPPERMGELIDAIRSRAAAERLIYQHEGVDEPVRVMPCPLTLRPDQLAYVHAASLTILGALKRLPDAYLASFPVREILKLEPAEERWLLDCWGPAHRENNPIFGRLDAMVDFTSPMWKDSLRFVEPNLTGIGGLHLAPTCDGILHDVVLPELLRHVPSLRLERTPDMRDLLVQELLDHLEVLGRPRGTIAMIDPKYEHDGPDEQDRLVRYLTDRHGLKVVHADPGELVLHDGDVYYHETRIDLCYRDYSVLDLEARAAGGANIDAVKKLFRENRMISSIAAELDQKSCWEILTDPALAQQLLTPEERQVARRHVLWTRILSDRRTTDPRGESVDLLKYARQNHESLVLKPNRGFGGRGVVVGPAVTSDEWDAAVDEALRSTDRFVLQELASIPVREFPVLGPKQGDAGGLAVHNEPFYVVMGFAATRYGVALMARASQKQVVNVAQHGGVCGPRVGPHAR
ncbi:MAG: hypothetical protein IBJ11_06295 [Phycisphaerales bacterium]|nr:hypothetical protein [Phycisphaerales bacterium]